ncbi:mediator complex subunit 13 C-terminal-domain-containing protein [Lipomyces kononenkoae]|uniref:Mediator complex subunit 13 C-terminal-domain-containing protein n=1 Tax=Lipomyces kononenkoae TaxID=34357 RepID=A0ACC3T7S1_LIPKO
MTTSPEKNFSNVFKVGTFDQIRYCIFVDPLARPLKILLAEWSLRQKLRTSLVAYHNKELWTFSLNEQTNPAVPDSCFGLKEISTGSFLPSTLTISDSTSPQAFPAAYVPLMLAFNGLVSRHLTTDYDYVPIGGVLLSPTQALLHYSLRLLSSGTLLLVPHYQHTTLYRISSAESEPIVDSKLILAPNGIDVSFVGKATELPVDASAIMANIYLSCGYRVLNERSWCNVRIGGSSTTYSWPSELCLTLPPWKSSGDASDLEWFRIGDPLDEVEDFVMSISRRIPSTDSSPSGFSQKDAGGANVAAQKKNAASVYPTPPDPAQIQPRPPTTPRDVDTDNGEYPLSSKWNVVGDGDQGIGQGGVAEEDDGLLLGDAEEVTEADFNFFDDDHNSTLFGDNSDNEMEMADHTDFLNHDMNTFNLDHIMEATTDEVAIYQQGAQTVSGSTDASPVQSKQETSTIITPPLSPLKVIAPIAPLKRKSVFAPLTFQPNVVDALDTKYSLGGRFYVPAEKSDSSESEDESENGSGIDHDHQAAKVPRFARVDDKHDGSTLDSRRGTDKPCENFSSDAYAARQPWWTLLSSASASWDGYLLSAIGSSPSTLRQPFLQKNGDDSFGDVENILQTLCEFVVWDNSLLDCYVPPPESRGVCGSDVVNVLRAIFGQVQPLSLQEYALVSGGSSMAVSEIPSLPDKVEESPGEALQDFMLQGDIFNIGLANPSLSLSSSSAASSVTTLLDDSNIISEPTKSVFHIEPPHFSFMRMNSVLEVLPPALRFWQIFGFAPQSGRKDVVSFIVYPGSDGMTSAASSFLERLKPVYEGSNLGNFELGNAGEFKNGLVPVQSSARTTEDALEDVRKTCVLLGRVLTKFVGDGLPNILVFVATPFSNPSSLLHLSQSAFQLKQEYVERLGVSPSPSSYGTAGRNVVVQLVPAEFFAARNTLVVPAQYKLVKFALMLYDKCRPQQQSSEDTPSENHYPAYTLARRTPSRIDFRVRPTPATGLFVENMYVHIAYARSRDRRFVSVAWADQYGELARVKIFPLVRRRDGGRPPRSWEDICGEIWERTLGLLPRVGMEWRLVFAKVGTMDQDELDVWINLASHATENVTATFVCVDTNPNLSVVDTTTTTAAAAGSSDQGRPNVMYSTPVATPQRQHDSPTTSTTADGAGANNNNSSYNNNNSSTTPVPVETSGGTPAAGATPTSGGIGYTTSGGGGGGAAVVDQDAVLVDVKDETYGVIMNHRLVLDPLDLFSVRFSLATGYLVKPGPGSTTTTSTTTKTAAARAAEDGTKLMSVLELSLLHYSSSRTTGDSKKMTMAPAPPAAADKIVADLLRQYRGLACYGAASGIGDGRNGVLPWHVAAVEKMQRTLGFLL